MRKETYYREIPRDLFNEAKLLKCIGRLCLLIHDGFTINGMLFEHDGSPFIIEQNEDDGSLWISNIRFEIAGNTVIFTSKYNSKSNYPLYCQKNYSEEYLVFEESGEYTDEFKEFCNSLELVK